MWTWGGGWLPELCEFWTWKCFSQELKCFPGDEWQSQELQLWSLTSKKLTRKIEIFLVRGCSFETEELLVYLYVQNADRHAVLIFTAPGNNVWKILHQPSNLVGTWKKKKKLLHAKKTKVRTAKCWQRNYRCSGSFVLGGRPCGIRPVLCKPVVSEQAECSNSTNSPKIR